MRLGFLVCVAVAPLSACSNAAVTVPPPPVVPAPTVTALLPVVPALLPVVRAPTIVIRSAQSLTGRGLIVVDGVLVEESDINPGDIEAVEIIKGAAATTLYAPQRDGPPIVIKTKRRSAAPRTNP